MTHPAPPDGSGGHALVTLDGRYHIVERIASGGMGEVFRARDAVLDREVAIKVLHRSLAGDRAFVDRFRREARAAAGISHPNIVAVYDWGAVDGIYYMVMEFVRGRATRELLNQTGKLEPAQAAEVVHQTLMAVGHAHQQGIVHRDIKPENILVTTDGVVKVANFGLARAYADSRQTQAGSVTGTVQYLAPEQIRGEPADPRSDLYSLGIVTYEFLTGQLPFTGETAMAIAYKHLSDRVPAPSVRIPSIPGELDGFVASATDRDRELRPESAAEMQRDLQAIEPMLPSARSLASLVGDIPEVMRDDEDQITEVVSASPLETQTKTITQTVPTRRRRARKTIGALVLVVALAAAAWGVWTYLIPHRAPVPGVVGTSVDVARARLSDAGFAVREAHGRYSPKVAAGRVLRVSPAAGAIVKRGATVTIVPSLGPPPVPVPSITGRTVAAAKSLLSKGGLTLTIASHRYDGQVPAGHIITQTPTDGQAPQGSEVTVVVSDGPPPQPVPNVVGKTQDTATARLHSAGFTVRIETGFSDTVASGMVISSAPTSGIQAPYGSEVTLVTSLGPQQFPCPDFRGLSRAAAQTLADEHGLKLVFQTVPGTSGSIVYSQTPGASATVIYGGTVTLYLV